MLHKTILTALVLASAFAGSIHAENSWAKFTLSYALAKSVVRPQMEPAMVTSCMKGNAALQTECQSQTGSVMDEMVSYFSYRMTTEKSMEELALMSGCLQNKSDSKACPQLNAYVVNTTKDYFKMMHSMADVMAKPKTGAGK